jgi:hypothetical protein
MKSEDMYEEKKQVPSPVNGGGMPGWGNLKIQIIHINFRKTLNTVYFK